MRQGQRRVRRQGHGHGQRRVVQLDGAVARVAVVGAVAAAAAPLHVGRVVVLHVRAQAHLVLGHLEAEAAAERAPVLAVQVGEVALEVVAPRKLLLADGAHQALALRLARVHQQTAQALAEEG